MSILSWIYKFLCDLFINHDYTGELTVIGTDEARFELHCEPDYVDVAFLDDPSNAPCDPGTNDAVEWEAKKVCCPNDCPGKCVNRLSKKWTLIVKWSVAGTRKIIWQVQG